MRALTLLSLLLLPVVASAGDVPRRMTWHGRLARADGSPETNPQSLKFSLYAGPSGGSPLWEETLQNVPVSNGYYAVVLGQATPLPLTVLNGQELYLGLALNGGAEQQPRVRVASVPYALKASDAHTLDGRLPSDFALTSHGHADATTSSSGFMSPADKTKLDGLSTSGFASLSHGHADATTSSSGFMSPADKTKLDGLNGSNFAPANHTHATPNPICVYRRETKPGDQVATVLCNTNEAMTGGGCAMDTGAAEGGVEQGFSGMTAIASGTGGLGMVCKGRGNGTGAGGSDVVQAWVTCCRWP